MSADALMCNGKASANDFAKFVSVHPRFIVKPLSEACGRGVQIFECGTESAEIEELFNNLLNTYSGIFLMEELIQQAEPLKKLHPHSVNTIRATTIILNGELIIYHPFLRIGWGGNIVDNGGADGILCGIDIETGKIFSAGNRLGNLEVHPTTGEQLIGMEIPYWEEAKAFVKELASVVPDNHYTGWDLALTPNGWVMVEGNRRGNFGQLPAQMGFREEFNAMLKSIGKKY